MNASQMLAHYNVTYEMVFEANHPKPGFLKKALLTLFVKYTVVSDTAYPKNGRTAPQFLVNKDKDFEVEKRRLVDYLKKVRALGETHFEGLESHSFGSLSSKQWNNMFYKHLDHHLRQFGV